MYTVYLDEAEHKALQLAMYGYKIVADARSARPDAGWAEQVKADVAHRVIKKLEAAKCED